jgi:SRSO17 transposase
MRVVANIPEGFEEAIEVFRPYFGAPAFEHFKRYVLGLIVSENLTVEGINRIYIEAMHPSSLNRFLTAGIWRQDRVNDARINMLKAKGALAGKGWLVIDDTLTHKTGEMIEAVGIFWDHCEKRHVLAHNIVTMEFVTPKGKSYPLDFRLYLKEDLCEKKKFEFKTKIQLARELIEYALSLGLEIQGVLFDSWYAAKDLIGYLRDNSLWWVTRLKSDRNIKIRGEYVQIREFAATLPKVAFRGVRIGKTTYQVFSKAVDLKGVGKVRIVISYDKEDFSEDPVYFATDQIRWEATRILKTYGNRSKIEAFFRDTKQNLGLEDYQLRDLRGIKRHWYLIFLAYSLLVSGMSGITQNLPKGPQTLGVLITGAYRNVFGDLVDWIASHLNSGKSTAEICTLAYRF